MHLGRQDRPARGVVHRQHHHIARLGIVQQRKCGIGLVAAQPNLRLALQAALVGRFMIRPCRGPSPLTRGSPVAQRSYRRRVGPIPAHAGQPACTRTGGKDTRAHPRSRGAAVLLDETQTCIKGPSPLTRGSLPNKVTQEFRQGPIPAHAGQPTRRQTSGRASWAHPRSRGAAFACSCSAGISRGPSPLTRGSPLVARGKPASRGPIPAHAGQP